MARKQKTIHYIYKTTCTISNRYYIGLHSTNNLNDGYMGSGKRLKYSIRKHGIENHTKEILEFFETRELLVEREKEIITFDLVGDKNCMNLVLGGGGFMLDDYHYECSKNGNKILNEKLKTDEKFYKTWKSNLVAGIKKAYRDGKLDRNQIKDGFKNKQHSDDTKKQMSETSKGMGIGETNSQYGTCWITRGGLNKKIKKENLNEYEQEGWFKGRV